MNGQRTNNVGNLTVFLKNRSKFTYFVRLLKSLHGLQETSGVLTAPWIWKLVRNWSVFPPFGNLFESCSLKHFTIFKWEGTSVCCTVIPMNHRHGFIIGFAGILTRKMEWTSSRHGISGWVSSPWEVCFELTSAEAAIWKPRLTATAKRWTRRLLAWRPPAWEHQGSPARVNLRLLLSAPEVLRTDTPGR